MHHYYSFTFIDSLPEGGTTHASVYKGYDEQFVSLPRIENAKADAGVSPGAVMLCCAYLGYMTPASFREQL